MVVFEIPWTFNTCAILKFKYCKDKHLSGNRYFIVYCEISLMTETEAVDEQDRLKQKLAQYAAIYLYRSNSKNKHLTKLLVNQVLKTE